MKISFTATGVDPGFSYKLLKKVLQFKFDWSYLSYYHIFFIIIGIIKKLV